MNKLFLNTIFKILSKGIDKGYKSGIRDIVSLNKKKFTEGKITKVEFAGDPVFKVDYTGKDIKAIENFKVSVFKMAGVGSYRLEEELKEISARRTKGDVIDREAYELEVRRTMLKYGIGLSDQPPSGWIKQALDTSIKTSIEGARWNRVTDPELKGLYSHWIYRTQNDDAVRPAHADMEGNTYSVKDRSASKLIPPNDYGCRCNPEYITSDEAQEHQVKEGSGDLKNIPEAFRYSPGNGEDILASWVEADLKDMPEEELKQLEKLLQDEFK